MVVSVGSDHAGFGLKMKMLEVIRGWGYEVVDNGCYDNSAPVYFPEVAKKVCQPVLDGKAEKAIMFCGTGVGASIACNKIPGIRASMIHDCLLYTSRLPICALCAGEKQRAPARAVQRKKRCARPTCPARGKRVGRCSIRTPQRTVRGIFVEAPGWNELK